MTLIQKEEAARQGDLQTNYQADPEIVAAPLAQLPRRVHPTQGQPALPAWLEEHPHWSRVGPTSRELLGKIASDATEPDVLTRDTVPVLAERYACSRGRVLRALTAARAHGIAYANPSFEILADGRPHQVGSVYRVVRDGLYLPQTKRELTPAQKRGAKVATKTRRKRLQEARKSHRSHRAFT